MKIHATRFTLIAALTGLALAAPGLIAATAQAQSATTISKKRLKREISERARSDKTKDRWARKGTVGRLSNPVYDRLVDDYANCSYWRAQKLLREGRIARLNAKLADPDIGADAATAAQNKIQQTLLEIQALNAKLAGCTHTKAADFIDWLVATYGNDALSWHKADKHDGESVRRHPRLPPDGCGPYTFATYNTQECRNGKMWSIDYNYYGQCDVATEVYISIVLDNDGNPIPCEPDATPLYPSSAVSFDDGLVCMPPDEWQEGVLSETAQAGVQIAIAPFGTDDLGASTLSVDEPMFGSAEVVGGTIYYSAPLTFSGADELVYTLTAESGEQHSFPVVVRVAPLQLVLQTPTPPSPGGFSKGDYGSLSF